MQNDLLHYANTWLTYQPDTGRFFWKKSANRGLRQEGRETATINSHGYKLIKLDKRLYKAHRIAFLIMTGRNPTLIDHIDRDKSNNRWSNLREATPSENSFNRDIDLRNKTGVSGVHFNTRESVYTVTYGKQYLGRSKSLEEAIKLRKKAENAE